MSTILQNTNKVTSLLICRKCGVLAGVTYSETGQTYAAVNSNVIHGAVQFGPRATVSPKLLAGAAKVERWKEIWFRNVVIHINRPSVGE